MAIKEFYFITPDEFKNWKQIDPILSGKLTNNQNEITYDDNYLYQAIGRATILINRYANKLGENYLKENWDNLNDAIKDEISLACAIQTQHYLINTTYYEQTDTGMNQGNINFNTTKNDTYFLIPEVIEILDKLGLYIRFAVNDATAGQQTNNKLEPWNMAGQDYQAPCLTVADGDERYVKKENAHTSPDNSLLIRDAGGVKSETQFYVNTDWVRRNARRGIGVKEIEITLIETTPSNEDIYKLTWKDDDNPSSIHEVIGTITVKNPDLSDYATTEYVDAQDNDIKKMHQNDFALLQNQIGTKTDKSYVDNLVATKQDKLMQKTTAGDVRPISGGLDANSKYLKNVPTPGSATDGVNKKYVDDQIGAHTGYTKAETDEKFETIVDHLADFDKKQDSFITSANLTLAENVSGELVLDLVSTQVLNAQNLFNLLEEGANISITLDNSKVKIGTK